MPRGSFGGDDEAGRGILAVGGVGREAAEGLRIRVALLVADPPQIGADVAEDGGGGLQLADKGPCVRPAVVGQRVDGALSRAPP